MNECREQPGGSHFCTLKSSHVFFSHGASLEQPIVLLPCNSRTGSQQILHFGWEWPILHIYISTYIVYRTFQGRYACGINYSNVLKLI